MLFYTPSQYIAILLDCYNLYKVLIRNDPIRTLEYDLTENALLKINEEIKNLTLIYRKIYDRIEIRQDLLENLHTNNASVNDRSTLQSFVESFNKPLIFEDPVNQKSLKDVFIWPEYKTNVLSGYQDDLKQL